MSDRQPITARLTDDGQIEARVPADRFTPDPAYQRRIAIGVSLLDDGQVEMALAQLKDRWGRPDPADPHQLPPRSYLYTKYTLEALLKGPAAALADFGRLMDFCVGPDVGPGPGGFAA
jgi:hypothetical protein